MAQNVLITGASSGIGMELARVFAARGYNLILTARNAQRLNELQDELKSIYPIEIVILPKDLTATRAAQEIYDELLAKKIEPDILINNAGVGLQGAFSESDISSQMNMIQLNISTLIQLSHLFLKNMKERRSGVILNVASTAAFMPGPYMAVYYASKAFVVSFSEALSSVAKDSGVQISVLCPGPTKTEFAATAQLERSRIFNSGLLKIMDARTVALITCKQLLRGKRCIIPGLLNKLTVQSTRITPRFFAMQIVKWLHKAG